VHALRGASLELRAGEVHALVGENGAGKSTLIKILTGAVQPDGGTIEVAGRRVGEHSPRAAKAAGIAAIYQQPALFPELTVAENLALGLEAGGLLRRVNWKARRRRAQELLDRVGARIDPDAEALSLSMPQQQLVEIARALGADARILILDEPTASLGDDDARHLLDVIRELRGRGVGMIYISHRLEELPQIADRVTVLRDGRTVGTRDMETVSREQLIALMVGRELSAVFPKREVPLGNVVLECDDVGCAASGVRDVSLVVCAGEIVGLAGLVGAGLGIAYVPEDRRRHGVVLDMPIAANVTLASLPAMSRAGALDTRREREVAADYTRRLGVKTPSIHTPVSSLSGGNQQKVALGRWLLTKPKLLILDEPTQGIDVGAKSEIHTLMCDLAAQGVAVLMISSELPEILGMSDRIAVMRGGTIVDVFSRANATQERILAAALGEPDARGDDVPEEVLPTKAGVSPSVA
jgi:rhamnose transport system ATP-binding protein